MAYTLRIWWGSLVLGGGGKGMNTLSEKESGYEWLCYQCSNVIANLEINNFSVYIRAGLIVSDSINEGIKYWAHMWILSLSHTHTGICMQ